MTKDQYHEALVQLARKQTKEKNELASRFALANNPYKIGDTIADKKGLVIKIEAIHITTYKELPCCFYKGLRIDSQGKPRPGMKGQIFQHDIKVPKA